MGENERVRGSSQNSERTKSHRRIIRIAVDGKMLCQGVRVDGAKGQREHEGKHVQANSSTQRYVTKLPE